MMIRLIKKIAIITGVISVLTVNSAMAATIPNDPRISFLTPIYDQIGVLRAWDKTTGSRNVIVAVVDSGVDMQHPDLRENIWHNPNERLNGLDDDNNGFIDDINGWDFINDDNDPSPVFDNKKQYQYSDLAHGTVVAGLIGAVGNNNTDASGVAWHVSIMPLRVMDEKGTGNIENVVKALRYAQANGAFIVNLSFGGPDSSIELENTLSDLYTQNVLTIVAAGNHDASTSGNLDFSPTYPACADQNSSVDTVLTVGSINDINQTSTFSNYGSCVDLVAPGERISSTVPYEPTLDAFKSSFTGYFSGTSMSAPLVSGAAALVKSLNPDFTAREVKGALYLSADPVEIPLGNKKTLGNGKLNVERALRVIRDTTINPEPEKDVKEENVKNKELLVVGKRVGFGEVRFYDTNFGVIKDVQLYEVTKKPKTISYAFGNDSYGFPIIYASHDGVIDMFTEDAVQVYSINPKMSGEITVQIADLMPNQGNELLVSSNRSNIVKIYDEVGNIITEIKNPLKKTGGLIVSILDGELYIAPTTNSSTTARCILTEGWNCAPHNKSKIAYQYFKLGDTTFQSKIINNKGVLEITGTGTQIIVNKASSLLSATLINNDEKLIAMSPTGKLISRVVLLNQAGQIVSEFPAFEKYNGGLSLGTVTLK